MGCVPAFRRGGAGAFLVPALLLSVSCAPPPAPGPLAPAGSGDLFVAGYHPWWAGEAAPYPMGILEQLFYFEVEAGPDGAFLDRHGWPGRWSGLLGRARAAEVQVVPTLTMHDPEAFESVFASPARSARLVSEVLALLRQTPQVRGVHLDVEVFRPVSREARDGYTAFVAALAGEMRRSDPGLGLSLFLLAFDDDDAYNERALAALSDYVVVQGYDFHNLNDANAGPVAAVRGWGRLNWGAVADRMEALGIPRRKIVMAAPLYGYQWPAASPDPGAPTLGPGIAVPLAAAPDVLPEAPRAQEQARRHGLRRDPESGSPYYAFQTADGGWVQGWFEDVASLREKVAFVRERGLGGIAFFPLPYGGATVWEALRDALRVP